jgi:pimeloyl-ACP methyl ester carboxylesterase
MNTVVSKDGTNIGYTVTGQGPGLILVQGAMGTAHNYRDLAQALSSDFTVYTPDRRGRGMSPKPFTPEHKIQRDVEDIEALCRHSEATSIFGLSSGAVIALTCTLRIEGIRRAVIYEPPFYFHNGIDKQRVERFDREVNKRHWVAAMTTAGEIVRLAPLPIRLLPRWLRKRFTATFMQGLGGGGGYAPLEDLLPAMRFDFAVVGEMSQHTRTFERLNKEVLLLGGTSIPKYLKLALEELAGTLPNVTRRTLPGLDHAANWNAERGGAPMVVADAVREYLQNSLASIN